MLAESIHSLADTGNQALLLLGGRAASREPTAAHPFGYGRERYFWAFVVSLVLFSLGSLFALFEGIDKLRHPHELDSPAIAMGILALGIALEGFSFRTAVVAANNVREGASWWSFIRNSKAPELPVVLLEDLGAMIGLVIAFFAITMALVTDNPRWDGAGTVSIGVLLGIIAVILAIEMRSLLLGEAASPSDRQAILDTIADSPDAERLIHIRTQHLGPDEVLVAAKVAFPPRMTFAEVATAIDDLEAAIRAQVPAARVIYIEPDVDRDREPVST
jgi:cation diffusion facilitator family transporter